MAYPMLSPPEYKRLWTCVLGLGRLFCACLLRTFLDLHGGLHLSNSRVMVATPLSHSQVACKVDCVIEQRYCLMTQ